MRSFLACRRGLAIAVLTAIAPAIPALAADNVPGQFDFYVLSLSWSPTYCKTAGSRANRQQCGGSHDYGFIVHGLWPQNTNGFPESCRSPYPARVPRKLGVKYFDIMPSMALIGHEWRTHGTCSGRDQASYFALARKARNKIAVPDSFKAGAPARAVATASIEAAFIKANPGLQPGGIAVACEGSLVEEVRICLTKSLAFRPCKAVDRQSCSIDRATLPASP